MNTKARAFISFLLILVIMGGLPKRARGSEEIINLVSDDAIIVAYVNAYKEDSGLSYPLKLWKEVLGRRTEYAKREEIKEIYDIWGHLEAVGALFIDQRETLQYIIIVKIVSKRNYDRKEQFNVFQESIKRLIKKREELQTLSYLDHKIIYSVDRYPSDLSAYVCIDDDIIAVGTNVEVLEEVVRVKKGKISLLAKDKKFMNMKSKLIGENDGFLYIDNKNRRFMNHLRKWEKEHYMTLLLSGEFLEAIGISFDIVNENTGKGKVIFFGRKKDTIFDDIQDDLIFFDEVIKRKFMAEKVNYISEITIDNKYVILDFKISDLELFWERVFGENRDEIFQGNKRTNSE